MSRTSASPALLDVSPPGRSRRPYTEEVTPDVLTRGIAGTPMDYHVIWDGSDYAARQGSRCSRALALITDAWTPVPLRELLLRAARIDGSVGFAPEMVREGVRQHQRAKGACYLLVRKTPAGEFLSVMDVPFPASYARPLPRGAVVMTRDRATPGTLARR